MNGRKTMNMRVWQMVTLRRVLGFGVIAMLPAAASAHTGVGATTGFVAGFSHPFGGFDHLLAMLAVGLWAAQMGGRARMVVPAAFVSLMMVGGLLALSGLYLPYVESGILASVLVLGILIAAGLKLPLPVSVLLVGSCAVFHGHAHGAEMPLAMSAVSYSLGFALATALLHAVGMAGGFALKRLSGAHVLRYAGGLIAISGAYLAVA
jgi:urease accessory protein